MSDRLAAAAKNVQSFLAGQACVSKAPSGFEWVAQARSLSTWTHLQPQMVSRRAKAAMRGREALGFTPEPSPEPLPEDDDDEACG